MDPLEGTARVLLDAAGSQTERKSKVDDAEAFLKAILKKTQAEVEEEAKANGISSRTLKRAKKAAGVKSSKAYDKWWWSLSPK